MVRILLAHMSTTESWPRLVASQRWQEILSPITFAERVVVSETEGNRLPGMQTICAPNGEEDGLFNLAALRNRVLDHAAASGYDGLMIVEADFLILRQPVMFPATWAMPRAIYDYAGYPAFPDLPVDMATLRDPHHNWTKLGPKQLIYVHCVMLHKSVFGKARWDEAYRGCGFDDWDFNNQMCGNVGQYQETDALLLHRWHPETNGDPRPENREYYESKWGKLEA